MNVTYENFIELQPEAAGANSNQRLWNFLLISFLLHLIIVMLLFDHYSATGFSQPYKFIPALTISLNQAHPSAQAITDSLPVTPVNETHKPERPENIDRHAEPLSPAITVTPVAKAILPVQPDQSQLPHAKKLIEKSLDYAAQAAKQMEARANPGMFITNAAREKLQLASIMLDQQDAKMDSPDKLVVSHNQYGDRVFQTGDKCAVIPAALFLFSFKELNSIIATHISCGNGKRESGFSLK